MDNLLDLALEIQSTLISKGYRFYFIGGIAVQFWGQNRLTDDVDLTLITEFKNEDAVINDLLESFRPRRPDSLELARAARVVLLESKDQIAIDIALGGFPFELEAFERSVLIPIGSKGSLRVIRAEDLVIIKSFAARPHDWEDVKSIIRSQGRESFDTARVFEIVKMLADLKEEPEILDKLKALFL